MPVYHHMGDDSRYPGDGEDRGGHQRDFEPLPEWKRNGPEDFADP